MNNVWLASDSELAQSQGWDLFETTLKGKSALLIERCDDQEIFEDDVSAVAFVKARAKAGCQVAAKALMLDEEYCAIA